MPLGRGLIGVSLHTDQQGELMHPDHSPYFKFTGRARVEKSINSLLGMIEGIAIDREINAAEINYLSIWLEDHQQLREKHPFSELVPVLELSLADRILTEEERDDLVWLCRKLRSQDYFDHVTADLQRLHAVVGGIVADTAISMEELRGLSEWVAEHEHLRGCWPYDEVGSLVTTVLADKRIDEKEHEMLFRYFSEFVALLDDRTIKSPPLATQEAIVGLCAVCPDVVFPDSTFCFTGASGRHRRADLASLVLLRGGRVVPNPTKSVDYLVIGADGNPCWAYACYGRKVEKAVQLRKAGVKILLIHESDFHDAVQDAREG